MTKLFSSQQIKGRDSFSVFCVYVSKRRERGRLWGCQRPLFTTTKGGYESSTVAASFSTDADITEENHNALRKADAAAVTIMQQHQCIDAKAPLLAKTLLLPHSKLWFTTLSSTSRARKLESFSARFYNESKV